MKTSNKTYDTLKMISLLAAPIIVFISSVLNIWEIPYTAQITATLGALDVLFGALVVALNNAYKNGISERVEGTDGNEV